MSLSLSDGGKTRGELSLKRLLDQTWIIIAFWTGPRLQLILLNVQKTRLFSVGELQLILPALWLINAARQKKERNEWRLTLHDHIKSKEKPQITTGLAN